MRVDSSANIFETKEACCGAAFLDTRIAQDKIEIVAWLYHHAKTYACIVGGTGIRAGGGRRLLELLLRPLHLGEERRVVDRPDHLADLLAVGIEESDLGEAADLVFPKRIGVRLGVDVDGDEVLDPDGKGKEPDWPAVAKTCEEALREKTKDLELAGWLTEANHLGNVAYRVGRKLEWDQETLRAKNAPEAAPFIRGEYPKGWKLS